ncbi:hypothetical protein L6164_025497 [Bauhinia variegata]|uniref:Uncharacterized protein n=1 Tax=Bauhinia variegata TaxID=167791 RepID=A0ACB9M253_BAUVA|nr:hypothetical protein L6164_025497 [Bauhinia variegata]
MASTDKPAEHEHKTTSRIGALVSGVTYLFDVLLRFLLFAASVVVIVVIVTSNQTVIISVDSLERRVKKFKHSAAFIYFLVAFCVSGLYSFLSALASISIILKPDRKLKFLLHFIFWDTLLLGMIASATGTAGGVAYLELKGDESLGLVKVCVVYNTFCSHLAGSLAVALLGNLVVVLLIWFSAFTIYSRVPK